ncbi:short-chain dehydrogenase/reductase family 9C member 7-like [Homarus americanus]|uniref:Short-chain dehydrogenase/reductase family 9C member 7-like n=1 Tax=Homarus americanus TaxID=6706 RepID=A0A8J5TH08_HOMAM|nr:short-chain dehydrogenase/reductase family 9C member 7-like [Homarus americanus]KAG7175094.1 Short-chain dehydrogenase/reductase family 9C member 7-like [Homarus americanus]
MSMRFYHMVGAWVLAWAALLVVSQRSWAVSCLALGLMAAHIADWVMKAAKNAMRRTCIDPTGKAIFITGCDTGFGRLLAVRLDKMGFKVYAGCLLPNGEGACLLQQEASAKLKVLSVDVTKDDEVRAAYKTIENDLGEDLSLWAVVNNAGIAAFTEIEWCPISEFRRVYEVNSLGPIRVTKEFMPLLRESKGRVVLVASLAGRYTFPGFTAYSMSKHATVSFADGLRLEMQKWGISVHTVEPTLYRTPISQEGPIHNALDRFWHQCSEDVRKSYGDEYIKDFKTTISSHLNRAKPSEKIKEVIDDMVDAVAGDDPKIRYVPSVITQIRAKLLSSLPDNLRDHFFLSSQPQTPPAYVTELRKKKKPRLMDPRTIRPGDQGRGKRLVRMFSMPNWTKNEMTPSPVKENEPMFKF